MLYDVSVRLSVRLSVTEVLWRIIANLGFKFRSHFTAHCDRRASCSTAAVLLAVLLAGGSSRAMLASARSLVSFSILSIFVTPNFARVPRLTVEPIFTRFSSYDVHPRLLHF